jgi:virginiamycin B lyase
VGAGAVWVANGLDGTVSRIDPGTDTVVASEVRGTVTRLDPHTNAVARTVDVGSATAGAAVAGDALWVTSLGRRAAIGAGS